VWGGFCCVSKCRSCLDTQETTVLGSMPAPPHLTGTGIRTVGDPCWNGSGPAPLNLRRLSVRHGDGAKIRNKGSFTIDADIGGVGLVSIDMHLRYGVGADAD
jgi:hypothetical protein